MQHKINMKGVIPIGLPMFQVSASTQSGPKSETETDPQSAAAGSELVELGDLRLKADVGIPRAEADADISITCAVESLDIPASLSGAKGCTSDVQRSAVGALAGGMFETAVSMLGTIIRVSWHSLKHKYTSKQTDTPKYFQH